ncbi:Hypothetical protein CINCED_3A020153 [Cinara cedri]|uniref:Uncharacterized protein n=1 Tax=Cinara cedri TaxID=506608 RepID=A0A5E4N3Q1_9HEMI|nr:Hypothetical protein CINCED_3A020153 [Cinara cedri]
MTPKISRLPVKQYTLKIVFDDLQRKRSRSHSHHERLISSTIEAYIAVPFRTRIMKHFYKSSSN